MTPWRTYIVALCATACSSGARPNSPNDDPEPTFEVALSHDLPSVTLAAGAEDATLCQSWTPGHSETLNVNAVRMVSEGGFHHMNFFFVPEDMYPGPDGTWNCADRDYSLELSAFAGGVFFAQSTQASEEVMRFAEGAVIPIPPGHKIIGNLHLLNTTPSPIDTHIRFDLATVDEADVTARLTGFIFQYGALDIAPRSQARYSTTCDVSAGHREHLGRPIDFSLYYLLPHYHDLGNYLRIDAVGGARDGEVLGETTTANGTPVGITLDPPTSLSGVESLRLTCGFDNPTDETIVWGIGRNEMCILFGFTDSENLWSWSSDDDTARVVDQGAEMTRSEADCTIITAPSSFYR